MSKDIVIENFLSNEDLLRCKDYFENSNEIVNDVLINNKQYSIEKANIIKFDTSYMIEYFNVEDKFILDLYNTYNNVLLDKIDNSIHTYYDNVEINFNETKKNLVYKINTANGNLLTANISIISDTDTENTCIVTIDENNTIPDNLFKL